MLVLAIDTSGKHGSIALCSCGAVSPGRAPSECAVLEVVPLSGGSYSAQLVPQISRLLSRHNLDKQAIEGFAAAAGPGSFTGLRVGLSTVKALAEVLAKPIATVSVLEALAWRHGLQTDATRVITALDAARGQVFMGEYVIRQTALPERRREVLLGVDEFLAEVKANPGAPVFTPDKLIADMLRASSLPVTEVPWPQADVIARMGALKLASGKGTSPEELDAHYIRRSDAEIFSRG